MISTMASRSRWCLGQIYGLVRVHDVHRFDYPMICCIHDLDLNDMVEVIFGCVQISVFRKKIPTRPSRDLNFDIKVKVQVTIVWSSSQPTIFIRNIGHMIWSEGNLEDKNLIYSNNFIPLQKRLLANLTLFGSEAEVNFMPNR